MGCAVSVHTDNESVAAALEAAEALQDAALDFAAATECLAHLADVLAFADSRHRAACAVAGVHCHRPPAREHAAEVALGALRALAPYLPLVTEASEARAREQLLDMPCAPRELTP